ncbi:hypothetical protein [Sphingomonas sp.]|uniref:hypothetical protein n=1 Tax=Sphingomonas sp. TaxID=28214 RepID=UPI001B2B9FBD|nr:hypothetical protein [Sphingomonas sp.]MBO9713525.1 hypothetical protein [Sphingomonas sp.]
MRSEHATPPGGSLPAPRPNRRLTALAKAVAERSRPLLPARAGLILGIEAGPGDQIELIWWRRDFREAARISAFPEGFCDAETDEGALQRAGSELLAYLGWRWPAPPSRLGVVTDGTGVVFAPDHPAPSAANWLLRHAGGSGRLYAILPLNPVGTCAVLQAGSSTSLH